MKKKVFCFLMALILCFTPVLFAGCENLEDLEDDFESGLGGGSGGGSGSGESFFADFFDGFKVVYSESQIGAEKEITELSDNLYDEILKGLTYYYGDGKDENNLYNNATFFPDAIRQTIINQGGNAVLDENVPDIAKHWNWTLNPNDANIPAGDIESFIAESSDYENFISIYKDRVNKYPLLSTYYLKAIQIVLYETMLGYEQTTFEAGHIVEEDTSVILSGVTVPAKQDIFTIKVKSSPKADLVGEIVYSYKYVYTLQTDGVTKDPADEYCGEQFESQKIRDYLGYWNEEVENPPANGGLKAEYYENATYSGLTKADADELITYILNEVIGKDVVEYDYENFRNSVNYRNYVYTVAEMIYSAVYDGSKEFVYTYKTDKMEVEYNFITEFLDPYLKALKEKPENAEKPIGELKAEFLDKEATFKPTSASYLRDYDTDMFFASGNAFEGMDGATSFENSPMSEYQSVAIMSAKDDLELGGIWMQIFSPNPDLAITVYVRFWAYDKETGEGQLFEWEQDEINFYQTSPYDSAYAEEDCEYHDYVEGKGYLYKTTEDGITGYYTDFEVGVDLTGVPEKFQAPYDRDDPTELQIDAIKLPKFENTTENKLKAQSEGGAVNGITEAQLNGDYAYKVVPSKNGFGGVTVLDENQINFSFYEMVFDIQKDPTLENTNYDYKLAVVTPV